MKTRIAKYKKRRLSEEQVEGRIANLEQLQDELIKLRIATTIWLLTTGSGMDGDEWEVISIHRTKEGAEAAKKAYEVPQTRPDGSIYTFDAEVEEWNIQE